MLKGEIYVACSLLSFGIALSGGFYIGLPWWLSLIISLVPAVYFVRKAAKWTDKFTDDVADRVTKRMK